MQILLAFGITRMTEIWCLSDPRLDMFSFLQIVHYYGLASYKLKLQSP